jgi:hypothetical protein
MMNSRIITWLHFLKENGFLHSILESKIMKIRRGFKGWRGYKQTRRINYKRIYP